MNLPLLISMPFAYLLAEMVINYFFNRKIEMIGKKEFNKAATLGAISTFLFLSSVFLGTLIAEMGGLDGYWLYVYPIFTAAAMSIGNFLATRLQGWVVEQEEKGKHIPILSGRRKKDKN